MKNINDLTSRAAMNFPEHYVELTAEVNTHTYNMLYGSSVADLLEIIACPAADFQRRFCAAQLLALLGDPRINIYNPAMCDIPEALAVVGSSTAQIQASYKKYKNVGVKQSWLHKEYPCHQVKISAFKIAKYLVTNLEYKEFLSATKKFPAPSSWIFGRYDQTKANHPVYSITVEQAQAYTQWLAEKTQRKFRLPTEVEWEFAAAGLDRNEFPWGKEFAANKANTVESGLLTTTPVGIYPTGASTFGCLDMAGNVEEYVSNAYYVYPGGLPIKDDLGGEGAYAIARGGSFTRFSDLACTRRRHGYYAKAIYAMGFRLAEDI